MERNKLFVLISLSIILFVVTFISLVSAQETQGGVAVPITTIELTEQGKDYSMKPGRLKFEFDGNLYAIQVRKVKQGYADFLIMTLDMNKPDDITAYTLDESFSLISGEKKEIDINKDGINDLSVELNKIIPTGKYNSIRSVGFSVKKINTKTSKAILTSENENIRSNNNIEVIDSNKMIKGEIQKPISEPLIILNKESKEQPTYSEKIINFFKGLFE